MKRPLYDILSDYIKLIREHKDDLTEKNGTPTFLPARRPGPVMPSDKSIAAYIKLVGEERHDEYREESIALDGQNSPAIHSLPYRYQLHTRHGSPRRLSPLHSSSRRPKSASTTSRDFRTAPRRSAIRIYANVSYHVLEEIGVNGARRSKRGGFGRINGATHSLWGDCRYSDRRRCTS